MGLFDRILPRSGPSAAPARKPSSAPASPASAPARKPGAPEERSRPPKGLETRPRPEAFGVSAPPAGPLRSLILDLAPFDSIEADIAADIFWAPAPEPRARLQVPESFLKLLRIEVSGRKLSISSHLGLTGARVRVSLSSPRLMEIHAAGESFIEADDILCGRLIATARGRSQLLLAGEAAEVHLEASDSAAIDAASLKAMIAVADLSGGAAILARVQDAIEADLREESSLLTVGRPRIIDARRHEPPSTLTIGGS